MKHWLLSFALLCLVAHARAQIAPSGDMSLGGIPKLIASKISEAKPAGIVTFSGKPGGGGYLPLWTFHDMAGRAYVEALNFGYRALSGEKPAGLFMPIALDLTSISARLWNFQWARDHVTRSIFPDTFLGPTVIFPIDGPQLKHLKLQKPQEWLGFVGSVRF